MRVVREKYDLGKSLEHFCREKGMSYYMLSEISRVPLTTIMHILHGTTKNPGFFTVLWICQALEISLSEFLEEA